MAHKIITTSPKRFWNGWRSEKLATYDFLTYDFLTDLFDFSTFLIYD